MKILLASNAETGLVGDSFKLIKEQSPKTWSFVQYQGHECDLSSDFGLALVGSYDSSTCDVESLLLELKRRGIPSLYIHNEPSLGCMVPPCDYFTVGSIPAKTLLTKWGYDCTRVFVTGWSALDYCKDSSLLKDVSSKEVFKEHLGIDNDRIVSLLLDAPKVCYGSLINYDTNFTSISVIEKAFGTISPLTLLDYLQHSEIIISDNISVLLLAVLFNKQARVLRPVSKNYYHVDEETLLEFSTKGELEDITNKQQLNSLLDDVNDLKLNKINFSKAGFNYYLLQYLPGTFDSDNTNRILKVMDFITQTHQLQASYYCKLLNILAQKCPELQDPIFQQKATATLAFFREFNG